MLDPIFTEQPSLIPLIRVAIVTVIELLEKAKTGRQDLDELIAGIVNNAVLERQPGGRAAYHRINSWVGVVPKPYTTDLNFAFEAKPEGWTLARLNENDDKSWACELREGFLTSYNRVVFGGKNHRDPTAALSLCLAAMRARLVDFGPVETRWRKVECECDAATTCPQGRVGSERRCQIMIKVVTP